jgi:hypothetical protein
VVTTGALDPRIDRVVFLIGVQPLTPTSFEIETEFRVDGKSNGLYGDGFAMWLTRARAQPGPVFGSAGACRRCYASVGIP